MSQQYPGEPPRQPTFTRHIGQPPQAPQYPPQQPWPPYGQQQPYGQQPWPQYQPPQPPGPPPKRKHRGLRAFAFSCLGLLVIVIAIIAANHNGSGPASVAANSTSAPAAPGSSPAAKPVKARTVATFTGSGTQKTPRFTVTATWKLVYNFSCATFGQSGNFQVFEDGGSDFNGVTVNDLAMSKSASTWAYDDAGTHYLAVNSECSWAVKIVDEP